MLRVNSSEVEALERTLPPVMDLLTSPEAKQAYRDSCRAISNDAWPRLVDDSDRLVSEMSSVVDSWTQLTDNSELLGNELELIEGQINKLSAADLSSLTLETLQNDLDQCKQVRVDGRLCA